jgi:DNA mismatch endonuclease (patch repair protein)
MPKSRLEFWGPKLKGNRERDRRNKAELERRGWTVLEIWECQIDAEHLSRLVGAIIEREIANENAAYARVE